MEQVSFFIQEPMRTVLRRLETQRSSFSIIHKGSEDFSVFLSLIAEGFDDPERLPVKELRKFPKQMTVDYLLITHNYYLNTLIPEIEVHFAEVIRTAEIGSMDLLRIYSEFCTYRQELVRHIAFEEEKLFPLILTSEAGGTCLHQSILHAAHHQHEDELAVILSKILTCSDRYSSFMPYRMLLQKLHTLDQDLVIHARIEDEVLLY